MGDSNNEDQSVRLLPPIDMGDSNNEDPIATHDVIIQDHCGWTPLHTASYYGHWKMAKLLIENGADVNIQERQCCSSRIAPT